jgi:hypothetical protein
MQPQLEKRLSRLKNPIIKAEIPIIDAPKSVIRGDPHQRKSVIPWEKYHENQ